MRYSYIFLFVLFLSAPATSQSLKQYKESIQSYLAQEDYYAAYHDIGIALTYEVETDSFEMLAGYAAFQLNAFSRAAKHLKSIVNKGITERHPEIEFYLGESLFRQGSYGEALIYFKSYQAAIVNQDDKEKQVALRIQSINWAKENFKKKDPLIQVKRLDDKINTRENEFSPSVFAGGLYISTQNVFEKGKKSDVLRNSGTILKYNESSLESMQLDSGLLEDKTHMVHPSFNEEGNAVYFTICGYQNEKQKLICNIYAKFKNDGKWGPKIKLPDPVNIPNFTSTQPHISRDPDTGLEKLYFVSDRPGGKGGMDIYSVLINDHEATSYAENIESINTPEDDLSPYYNPKTKTLFFSSSGQIGFGGQDIYRYSFRGKDQLKIINLGASVNSSYDDLYYVEDSISRKGFLVSNKPASQYLDEEIQACCFDIYRIKYIPATLDLLVQTRDKYDSSALNNVKVVLRDITEKDTSQLSQQLPDKAAYNMKVTEDRKYMIIGSKEGWISDTNYCSTIDLEDLSTITKDLYLTEIKSLHAATFERTTNVNLKGVTVELWDLDNNQLLSSSMNPDSNFFDFKLLKGKNYRLSAKKPKYESTNVDIKALETALEPVLFRKLFLELTAIAELRKLLPIRLFFENDMPDPRSESDSTNVGFLDIYNDYYNRKPIYIQEFTRSMKGPSRDRVAIQIDSFFNKDVKANAEKLQLFMDKLLIIVEEGHQIDIFLKGYASPRAKSEYNHLLSSRRVTSVRNEFDRYNKNAFHDFIGSGVLQIKEIPFGESQSSTDVSDDLQDTRNSIYNLKAAFERRVEILEILKGVDENVNQK